MPKNNKKIDVPVSVDLSDFDLKMYTEDKEIRLNVKVYNRKDLLMVNRALTEFLLKIVRR